ncbi:MAG TPA: hypothetical protein VED66_01745, partial [Candidatus Sulfotelmatobacter sp.]|nr:hypothetical protein [Candidatus Sulfotelmatobacter sp.]
MLAATKCLFASALLFSALPVLGAEETPSVAPTAAPNAVVKCPGVTGIPFTADAEQALPLRLVGSLSCGEGVYVLSDDEGYTAHIRTSDGKDGYVARMYLQESATAPAVHTASAAPVHHRSVATPVNGVVRWAAGAPGCDQFVSHGRHVESITANGITVQVSIQDSGWKYRANIAISNQSASNVDVTPGIITLDELQPHLRTLPATDPEKIAHTSTHQVLWTFADAVPSPSAVTPQLAHTSEADRLAPANDYLNPHMTLASGR